MSTPNETRTNLIKALDALQKTRQKLSALEAAHHEPIAVIGMACRLPGADTPEAFWTLLHEGRDLVTAVPSTRWNMDHYYDPVPGKPGKSYVREGAFLAHVDSFDPQFFGISPREAMLLDPQQRLLLEVTWEALERAGQAPTALQQSKTGVFVGVSPSEYALLMDDITGADAYTSTGNGVIFASGRLSYVLGLQGPNLVIDTACSASLIGVHLACESLRTRSSDLALAGGVHLMLAPQGYVTMSQLQALAPDGRCKTFDEAANGFGRGEGCGMVVLKRLSDAVAAGDPILALLRGSAINHDGPSSGLTVPSATAQADLIRQALANGQVAAEMVGYLEAHGTGTALGDPIEIRALSAVFGQRPAPLVVGSVKTNLGHLEEAAGITSLIKVILAMQHNEIPPHLHLHHPSPHIDWANLNLQVPTTGVPWPAGKKIAGVSSFGMGGSNAHVVLEEAPPVAQETGDWRHETGDSGPGTKDQGQEEPWHLLTLSAKSGAALTALAAAYLEHLSTHPALDLGDLCYTAYTGRGHFAHRLTIVANSAAQIQHQLALYGAGKPALGLQQTLAPEHQTPPPVAFLFTGQGAQYVNMGRELYATEPTFRAALDQCAALYQAETGESLLAVLYPEVTTDDRRPTTADERSSVVGRGGLPGASLDDTTYTQPALFALEYALAMLWQAWGIQPALLIGHSVGELVAACLAGVFSLADGMKLVAARGRLMGALPQNGAMIAVQVDEAHAQRLLAPYADRVAIAAVNGPNNLVLSGQRDAIEAVVGRLLSVVAADAIENRDQGASAKIKHLAVSHAFHSPLMDPMLAEFRQIAATITYHAPRLPLVSNVTGKVAGADIATPDYWVRHVRATVRFADGVATLVEHGVGIFLEIGPKPVLLGMAGPVASSQKTEDRGERTKDNLPIMLPSLRENQSDWQQMLESLAGCYGQGHAIDWHGLAQAQPRRKLVLPTYPFQRQRYWLEQSASPSPMPTAHLHNPLLQLLANGEWAQVQQKLAATGQWSAEVAAALPTILQLLAEQPPQPHTVVFDYYNAVAQLAVAEEEAHIYDAEAFLTFSIFPEVVPDFSWFVAAADKTRRAAHRQMARQGQEELRRLLFTPVDFAACRTVMDFGCGYGADLVALAAQHPHLTLYGYTISSAQAQVGQQKAAAQGLAERIQIFCRDSATDAFPQSSDLIMGTEVACHIKDKAALFANIGAHLNPGGMVVLADFISHAGFPIEHEETSSFLVTPAEWLDLFSQQGLQLVSHIDLSREIANFLYDPQIEDHLAELRADPTVDEPIYAATVSYNNQHKLMRQGLLSYALLAAQQQTSLSGEALREWNRAMLASPTTYAEITPTQWLYTTAWEPTPLPETTNSVAGGQWLIFADEQGVGAQLATQLAGQGARSLLLWPGSQLAKTADGWRLPPLATADLVRILQGELAAGRTLQGIVHLWSLHGDPSSALTLAEIEQTLEWSCGSTLALVQALDQVGIATTPLWLVTQGAVAVQGSVPTPNQSALWGLGGTIAQEYPGLSCVRLDLEATTAAENGRRLSQELVHGSTAERVAYRQAVRYAAQLSRFTAAPLSADHRELSIHADSSYLITGGVGGLGIQVAQWLAAKGARHLILTSRRGVSSPTAQVAVQQLTAAGVQVQIVPGDVANAADLAHLFQTIHRELPPLRGIVHAAGLVEPTPLRELSWASFQRVSAPKIQGSWQIHTLTQAAGFADALDFCVYFSSASSVLDTSGVGSYAAANAFLDGLAAYRQAAGLPALSINWGPWDEAGMAGAYRADAANPTPVRNHGMGLIPAEQGLLFLETLLQQPAAQVGVLPVNWRRYRQLAPAASHFLARFLPALPAPSATQQQTLRATVATLTPEAGLAHLVAYLQEAVAHILRMATPPLPHERFFDLGMDSLMAVELRNRLQQGTGLPLAATLFFKYANIEALADYFLTELATPPLDETAADEEDALPETANGATNPLWDSAAPPNSIDEIADLSEPEVEASIAAALAKLTGQINRN